MAQGRENKYQYKCPRWALGSAGGSGLGEGGLSELVGGGARTEKEDQAVISLREYLPAPIERKVTKLLTFSQPRLLKVTEILEEI